MTKYNFYARELDRAYKSMEMEVFALRNKLKDAESKYNGLLNSSESNFKYIGERDLKLQQAKIRLELAKKECDNGIPAHFNAFIKKRNDIGQQFKSELEEDSLANPDDVDDKTVMLIKSGVLNGNDLSSLANRFKDNATMLKLIGAEADRLVNTFGSKSEIDLSDSDKRSYSSAVQTSVFCKNGRNTAERNWSDLCEATKYFTNERHNDIEHITTMMTHYSELMDNAISQF